MKLPFNKVISPLMRRYFNPMKSLCGHPAFNFSTQYTYFCSSLGMLLSICYLRKHCGEEPTPSLVTIESIEDLNQDFKLIHDLRIIGTTIGLIQYACLLAGCYTENPALFLPNLIGQTFVVALKIVNVMLLLVSNRKKSRARLFHEISSIMVMVFNLLQEFCVFRQILCICDL